MHFKNGKHIKGTVIPQYEKSFSFKYEQWVCGKNLKNADYCSKLYKTSVIVVSNKTKN